MNTARKHFFLIHFNSSGIINRCLVRNISSSVYGNFGNGNLEVIHFGILLQDEGNLCPRKLNAKKFFHSLSWCAGWKLHHQKHQEIVNQGEVLFNFRLCLLTTRCWKIPFDDFLKAWWFIPKEKLFFFRHRDLSVHATNLHCITSFITFFSAASVCRYRHAQARVQFYIHSQSADDDDKNHHMWELRGLESMMRDGEREREKKQIVVNNSYLPSLF